MLAFGSPPGGRWRRSDLGVVLAFVFSCGGASVPNGPGLVVEFDASVALDVRVTDVVTESSPAPDASAPDATRDNGVDVSVGVEAGIDALLGVETGSDAFIEATDANDCPVDCNRLLHLRLGASVPCVAGGCVVPPAACEDGYAHCTANPNDGCETDLSRAESCGSCTNVCRGLLPLCVSRGDTYACNSTCTLPTPDLCGSTCVDFASDFHNCGGCNNWCLITNAQSACVGGSCVVLRCFPFDYADCGPGLGCETQLGTAQNCSRCGDTTCSLAHTLFTCSGADNCASAVCEPGFANCNTTRPDCETSFDAGGTCLPTYVGSVPLATISGDAAALAIDSDGSYFLAGAFTGSVDFDPGPGMDIRTPVETFDAYLTKFSANGSYAWTRTFSVHGNSSIVHLAAAANGAVIAVGSYEDTIDLDPGVGVDLHQTALAFSPELFVVKLNADGSFGWGTALGSNSANLSNVSTDATGDVYIGGAINGDLDVDPGPGQDVRTGVISGTAFVMKLTSGGGVAWARTIDNGRCFGGLTGLATAPDGTLWTTGYFETGCTLSPPGPVPNLNNDVFVIAFSPTGDVRGKWTFGGPYDDNVSAIAVGSNGSIFVGGQAQGTVDFDPGPAVAERWLNGGYVLNLGSDGSFRWAQTLAQIPILSLAAMPDGGVLAAGTSSLTAGTSSGAVVTRLNSNGSSVWSFAAGNAYTNLRAVASSATGFAISGGHSGSADFNPGAGMDIISGNVTFLSRYSF